MKKEVSITRDTFKADDGRTHPFIRIVIELGGKFFPLYPKADDKKLLNYLLNQSLDCEVE